MVNHFLRPVEVFFISRFGKNEAPQTDIESGVPWKIQPAIFFWPWNRHWSIDVCMAVKIIIIKVLDMVYKAICFGFDGSRRDLPHSFPKRIRDPSEEFMCIVHGLFFVEIPISMFAPWKQTCAGLRTILQEESKVICNRLLIFSVAGNFAQIVHRLEHHDILKQISSVYASVA